MKSSTDITTFSEYLIDEARLLKGTAEQIFFPTTAEEVATIVQQAQQQQVKITISGGGTGISGGRVPQGGWIIATDKLLTVPNGKVWTDPETKITYSVLLDTEKQLITVPAAMTVKAIQNFVHEQGWFYPPDPTERSSFIAGNVATNASGARSFKYGATRNWIQELQIVLPQGEIIYLNRENLPTIKDKINIQSNQKIYTIPKPNYKIAQTRKNVAGPIITEKSQPIDLFIGTDGIFGIITQVTIKIIKPAKHIISIMAYCDSVEKALALVQTCITNREKQQVPVPLSVELLDERASKIMRTTDNTIPEHVKATIILEQELQSDTESEEFITYWIEELDRLNIEDTSVAQSYAEIEHHKQLRHTVPETMNTLARNNGYSKLGTDYAVPTKKIGDIFALAFKLGRQFEEYQSTILPLTTFGYALWAHAGDAHVHINFLPRSKKEHQKAKNLMIEFMQQVVKWGGTIAAEHGLGKKQFGGHPALYYQYGLSGLEQITKMKITLDPLNLLNTENLIGKI